MWYRAFGWPENPFSIRPSPVVVGLAETKEALLSDLLAGSPALLLGPTGMGKTSLLLWLREQIRTTRFRPLYLSLHSLPQPQGESLLFAIQRGLFHQRIRLRFKAGLILLLDEAQELSESSSSLLQEAFDRGLLRAFLLAACAEPPLPQPLRSRIGPNVYRLESLSLPERLALLKHRMDGKNPFTEEALALLAERAGPSPRALLQAAELVCKRLSFKAELGEPITPADLFPLLTAQVGETPTPTVSHPETTHALSHPSGETKASATPIPTVSHRATASPTPQPPAGIEAAETGITTLSHSETTPMVSQPSVETNAGETPIPSVSHRATTATPPSHPSPEAGETTMGTQPPQSQEGDKSGQPCETPSRSLSHRRDKRATARDKSLSPMQLELLGLLLSGPKSVQELSAGLSSPPGSVRRQLSRLRDLALIQSLPGSNPKKFTLTQEALEILSPKGGDPVDN